ncbi:MAG: hypothetical protein ACK4E2_05420 [Pseudothermotoga sp.]
MKLVCATWQLLIASLHDQGGFLYVLVQKIVQNRFYSILRTLKSAVNKYLS